MSRLFRRLWGVGTEALPDERDTSGEWADATRAEWLGLRDAAAAGFYNTTGGELFRGFPVGPADVVVDVGCGEGAAAAFCARLGARVIAVDHHQDTVSAARTALADSGRTDHEFLVAPAEQVPVPDETATRVMCMEVLEHVADPAVVLTELWRIGRPGALYLITVPDPRGEELQQRMAPPSYFQPPNHIRVIGRDDLEQWVAHAGFEVLAHEYTGFYWVLWFALFWSRGVPFENPRDPVLDLWTQCWAALLESPDGAAVKRQLDEFMPKNQVILARKPEGVGAGD